MPKLDLEAIQQKINKNLPQPSEQRPSERLSGSENLASDHPLWELWTRFSEIYGHQWASQQGDEPNDTWIRGLAGLSPDEYAVGFNALLKRTDTWPPNLVEFRQLCTQYDPNAWKRKAHRVVDRSQLLENKTAKEARRAQNLENIRKLREEAGL